MNRILPYLTIIRIGNVGITAIAVALGFWLGRSPQPFISLLLLAVSGAAAAGFGNVINDIKDISTDRISHPSRALPHGEISVTAAWMYTAILASIALTASLFVSLHHGIAALIPLFLLYAYTRFLKSTPIVGNILVSLLVGYAIIFGGIGSPLFTRLLLPASLAFLLNFAREIIKDIQDKEGDSAAGITTSATLSETTLKAIIWSISVVYALLLLLPFFLRHFGLIYAALCLLIALPLHVLWIFQFKGKSWHSHLETISFIIKLELITGLFAMAADEAMRILC